MPFQRTRCLLVLSEDDRKKLNTISNSRKEPHSRVVRSKIMLAYSQGMGSSQIAHDLKIDRPIVERTINRALAGGIEAGLSDLFRGGRPTNITDEAKVWVKNIACKKPVELGFAAETWTYSELIKYIKKQCNTEGHPCLDKISKGSLSRILNEVEIKPHKITYYLERRDPEFEQKMAEVLCLYREVQMINNQVNECPDFRHTSTTISYDEKPGIQAIGYTAPDLAPVPGKYKTIGRDHEYKRYGTVSLLAGIDLHSGHVTGLVRESHTSKDFIDFLKMVDSYYPNNWKIKILLDNHSTHVSKETIKWLTKLPNRFEFVYTPKHGSWLNLIESFFSKMTRSFLRSIRVNSKTELVSRIHKYLEEINSDPVVFKWKYKLEEPML